MKVFQGFICSKGLAGMPKRGVGPLPVLCNVWCMPAVIAVLLSVQNMLTAQSCISGCAPIAT